MDISIKSVTDDAVVLEGYGVIFGTTDLHGEKFAQDTEFFLSNLKNIPVLWEHNMGALTDILGWATPVKTDEVGVFFELNLRRSNAYVEAIRKLAEKGRIGLSTGALPQTIVRDGENKTIKQWQICEISATVTPAEFRTLGVNEVKALADSLDGDSEFNKWAKDLLKDTEGEQPVSNDESPVVEDTEIKNFETIIVVEEKMEDEVKQDGNTPADSEVGAIKAKLDGFEAALTKLMGVLENTSAAKAGYVTQTGGTSDKNVKSFGDFLVAIKRGDEKRLSGIYGSVKDLGEGSGAAGGFLVPEEYSTNLLQVAAVQNQIYGRVQHIPVTRESGTYPALDQYFTPTAGSGQTAFAGGVKGTFTAPGAQFQETEPSFSKLSWRLNKIGGITEVENELIEDSPFAIEALLRGLFAVAIAARNERNILRGSGVGEPLGILNCEAAIGIDDTTTGDFKWDDVASMYSRFKSVGGTPVWVIHPSVWPKIMKMTNGSTAVWQANMQGAPANLLNGYPILVSEHMNQINNTGSVLLADLSGYLFFEKSGLSIAYSDQVGFSRDVGTWRFRQRNDGRAWLLDAVTLSDEQGSYSVSPFIYNVKS